MSAVVCLEDIVGELEMANDQTEVFLNIRAGEFVYLSEFGDREQNEELAEEIDAHEEDYLFFCIPFFIWIINSSIMSIIVDKSRIFVYNY